MSNAAKNFDILAISLSVPHNYYLIIWWPNKIFIIYFHICI